MRFYCSFLVGWLTVTSSCCTVEKSNDTASPLQRVFRLSKLDFFVECVGRPLLSKKMDLWQALRQVPWHACGAGPVACFLTMRHYDYSKSFAFRNWIYPVFSNRYVELFFLFHWMGLVQGFDCCLTGGYRCRSVMLSFTNLGRSSCFGHRIDKINEKQDSTIVVAEAFL